MIGAVNGRKDKMELAMLCIFTILAFTAVFTTINALAYIAVKSDDYKFSMTIASFCWAMVLMLMKGY